jgi:hypothetical protein
MPRVKVLVGLAAWLGVVGLGFWGLALYETRPGTEAAAPPSWPAQSGLALDPDRPTLMLFLHPHCPCSRASLNELEGLLQRHPQDLRTYVLVCKPPGVPEGWEQSATWQQAVALPGVRLQADDRDRERRLFGAETSGQVLLFDRTGRLRYSGGITPARGREGDNPGRAAVEALLRGETAAVSQGPVFGCPLTDPE